MTNKINHLSLSPENQDSSVAINVLLATFNSSRFLIEMLESLIKQDYPHWRLLISDGGSTDGTLKIIDRYQQMYPGRIVSVSSGKPMDACQNFSYLFENNQSDYVMFCDHDDIWFPDKITKTWAAMQWAEKIHTKNKPLLVFTDQQVVDQDCIKVCDSNLKHQHLNPRRLNLNQLLLQNVPSGCAMMINRALIDQSQPIPPQAVMHDHWISLVAAAFGEILFLNQTTMLYRQHTDNFYGAPEYGWGHFYHRYQQGFDIIRSRLSKNIDQAIAFYGRYRDILHPQQRQMLYELSEWPHLSWLKRRQVLLKHRIFKTGFRRNLGLFCIA